MIKLFRITLFILISCKLTFAQNPSAKTNHDKVDLLVEKYYKSFEAAGLAVGIVKQGNDFYSNTFGYQNIDSKTPLTEYSMFHMASISKPVTATIIAKLYEDSLIDIDKPYIDYVPFFKMADTLYNKVTTRQLVTHLSGMPYIQDYQFDNPTLDSTASRQLVMDLSQKKLLREPGKEYDYSNYAYDLLAELVNQVAQQTFEDYATENIFKPLGMGYSTFLKGEINDSIATSPHVYNNSTFEISVSSTYPYNRLHAPSTCFHSNLNDMKIWIEANLNKGVYKGNRILSDTSYNLLWTPAVERRKSGYVGFGWFIDDYDSIQIISHAGGDPGYKNFLVLIPTLETGIIVMSNSESIPPQKLAYEIIDIILGKSVDLPKKPISLPIGKAITQQNSENAKELYYKLKTNKFDSYDFSEKSLNNLGYDILVRYNFDDAIAIFKLNTQAYPESANTWDSLGDGYFWKGDKENAVKSYKKALEIDPNKMNSINRLKKLEKQK